MYWIADFQGFRFGKDKFIVKEFACIPLTNNFPENVSCYLFEPPFDWTHMGVEDRKANRFLESHLHGILWQAGSVPYSKCLFLIKEKLQDAEKIFVKGIDKKILLQFMFPNKIIFDLNDMRCPSLRKLPEDDRVKCYHHYKDNYKTCSLQHVVKLWNWLQVYYRLQEHIGTDEVDAPEKEEDRERIDLARFRKCENYMF